MFQQMRASRREEERQERLARIKQREDEIYIRHALGEDVADDISGLTDEFIINLLGREKAAEHFFKEHQRYGVLQPRRRRLRCLLFGCKVGSPCRYYPRCTACAGRCVRCFQVVLAKMKLLR